MLADSLLPELIRKAAARLASRILRRIQFVVVFSLFYTPASVERFLDTPAWRSSEPRQ